MTNQTDLEKVLGIVGRRSEAQCSTYWIGNDARPALVFADKPASWRDQALIIAAIKDWIREKLPILSFVEREAIPGECCLWIVYNFADKKQVNQEAYYPTWLDAYVALCLEVHKMTEVGE